MNDDIASGKWKDFKGELLNQWGKLTDDDLDRTKGNSLSIMGLIQEKYGHAKEEVSEKFEQLKKAFNDKLESSKDSGLKSAADNTDSVKKDLRNS